MFLTLFFDTHEYDFNVSLHSTRAAAEASFEKLLRDYIVPEGTPMPPKESWPDLFDEDTGEAPHIYEITADGGPPRDIGLIFCGNVSLQECRP